MKNLLILFLLGLTFSSCDQEKYGPLGVLKPFPDSIFFLIKDNDKRLPDSTLNRTNLVYFVSSQRKYVPDFSRGINSFYPLGIFETRDIAFLSADQGIKNFYLEYPSGDVDTINAEYRRVTKADGDNNCACEVPLVTLKFNGKKVSIDTSLHEARVYVFQK